MYKLYIKKDGTYKNPKLFKSLDEAKANAVEEYLIIEEKDGTNTIIEQNLILESRIKDDGDER